MTRERTETSHVGFADFAYFFWPPLPDWFVVSACRPASALTRDLSPSPTTAAALCNQQQQIGEYFPRIRRRAAHFCIKKENSFKLHQRAVV